MSGNGRNLNKQPAPVEPSRAPFDAQTPYAHLNLFGALTLLGHDARDATPTGKRAKALLAMLALAPNGRRGRAWLQDRLWSAKDAARGRASLRQELSNLRQHLETHGLALLATAGDDVVLDLAQLTIDAFTVTPAPHLDLLEGMDIGDPEFETWLSEERAYWYARLDAAPIQLAVPSDGAPAVTAADGRDEGTLIPRTLFPHLLLQPFEALGEEARLHYFTKGLDDELATVVGSIVGTYRIIDPALTDGIRADYRLQGSVRLDGMLRIHARITSLRDGAIVWNERFDVEGAQGFDAQERVSRRIVEAIQMALSDGRWAEYWTKSDTSIRAWELFQKGRVQEGLASRSALSKAIRFYREALAVDPNFLQARISLGFCLLDGLRLAWLANPLKAREEVAALCDQIAELAPHDLHGRALSAFHLIYSGQYEEALATMTEVVAEAPESPEMLAYFAAIFGYCGELQKAIDLYRHALTLTPHPPVWIRTNLILDSLIIGRSDVGAQIAEVLNGDPDNVRAHVAKVVHLVRQERLDEARIVAERLRHIQPDFASATWRSRMFFRDITHHEIIAADLRKAGL